MGASLLRLHFHDCFVNGCDGSILLDDDTPSFKGEKNAAPNKNSVRGFDVIDKIKTAVEGICPKTVSCADILAIAAMESVSQLGGPNYEVQLGRRDSKTANMTDANINMPPPFSNLSSLLSSFKSKGLSATDLVALSGAHTIGKARCVTFKNRLYSEKNIDAGFKKALIDICPISSTKGDNNSAPLDIESQDVFDNSYYKDLVSNKGLLTSDQQLLNDINVNGQSTLHVRKYEKHEQEFFDDFAKGMINMGAIGPLTRKKGEIRKHCGKVN